MGKLTHNEIEELLGVYALDAVEADEAAEIEEHLSTCPRCRAELTAHREVAGLFAYAGQSAPPGLWDRITAGMQETPPELRLDRMRASMVTPETLLDAPADVLPFARAASGAPDGTGARHRSTSRPGRSIGLRTFVAAAAAAAVIIGVLGVNLLHARQRADQPVAKGLPSGATMADVTQALNQKGSRRVVMVPPSGHSASLDAVVTTSGTSYLYHPDMTPLGADRTYQVWGVVGNREISYGLLGTNPAQVIRFNAGLGVRELAVTDEVASGVVATHQPFVVEGAVTPAL